jgi:nitrilase
MRELHPKPVLGGHESVKIAVAQVPSAFLDRKKTIARVCAVIREAAQNDAALVVFPEVWVSGYPFWSEGWDSQIPAWIDARMRFREAALVIPSDDTDRLSQAAREANIYVAIGCNELDARPEVETIYNTLLFIGRDGKLIGRRRKLQPTFCERLFWGHAVYPGAFALHTGPRLQEADKEGLFWGHAATRAHVIEAAPSSCAPAEYTPRTMCPTISPTRAA